MPGVFLRAEWRDLAMLNYEVDPALVRPFVPAGLTRAVRRAERMLGAEVCT